MGRSETHGHGHVNNVKLWEIKKERINKYVWLFTQTSYPFLFSGLINWFEKNHNSHLLMSPVGTTTNHKLYHIILLVEPCIAQFLSNSIQIGLIQSIWSMLIHFGPFGQIQSIWSTPSTGLSLVNYCPIRSMSVWPNLALGWFFRLDAK